MEIRYFLTYARRMNIPISIILLLGSSISSCAATTSFNLKGSWASPYPDSNVTITSEFESLAIDQNPVSAIGEYGIKSLIFSFYGYGPFISPVTLTADATNSSLLLYPAAPGEIRLKGIFDTSSRLPNGIFAVNFDLRLVVDALNSDRIGALLLPMHTKGASLYILSQGGAYSNSIVNSNVTISQTPIPEPTSIYLVLAGLLGVIGFGTSRRI